MHRYWKPAGVQTKSKGGKHGMMGHVKGRPSKEFQRQQITSIRIRTWKGVFAFTAPQYGDKRHPHARSRYYITNYQTNVITKSDLK